MDLNHLMNGYDLLQLSTYPVIVWILQLFMMAGIFGNGSGIGDYTYAEAAFMFAYSLASLGIYYIFFRNVANIPETYIYEGNLDRLMSRPTNTYFQILLEKFFVDKVGDFIIGVVLIMIYGQKINISWDKKIYIVHSPCILFSAYLLGNKL